VGAAGFTKLKAKFSELLPTDLPVDSDMQGIDEIWKYFIDAVFTNIEKLGDYKKPDRIPDIWLFAIADNLNIEYDDNIDYNDLRRLIYKAIPKNKQRKTVTDIFDSIQAVTGVRPAFTEQAIAIGGFAQANDVGQYTYGMLFNQNDAVADDPILWYQGGGYIPILLDIKGTYSTDILNKVYTIVAKKKIVSSVVIVGYYTGVVWTPLKEIWSTDLAQTGAGTHKIRY
jgi:hypothetical protein